jgi:uncharacterized protein (TIGR02246 family)
MPDVFLKEGAMTRAAAVVFFVMSLFGRTPAPTALTDSPPRDPAILKAADAYLAAFLAGDAAAVAALHRDDAVVMPPHVAAVVGRGAIERYYRDMFKGPFKMTAFTFTHWTTTVVGDTAYDVGAYKQTFAGGSAGPVDDAGKYVVILRRTGGGWKAAYVIYNSDNDSSLFKR